MAKKRYVIKDKNSKYNKNTDDRYCFDLTTKQEKKIFLECEDMLHKIPQNISKESFFSYIYSYVFLRDTFFSFVKLYTYDIKIDRNFLSFEEKKRFNDVFALALQYFTDTNQNLLTKREFQLLCKSDKNDYKLYTAIINIFQRHEVKNYLNKQFNINTLITSDNIFNKVIECIRLFFQQSNSFIQEKMQFFMKKYQEEILLTFNV